MPAPIFENHFSPNKHDASWDDLDDTSLVPTGKNARQLAPDAVAYTDTPARVSLGSRRSTIENRNQVAMFKCDKCRGSGKWSPSLYSSFIGPCRKCKGTGKLKTDPETLAKRKQAALEKKRAAAGAYIAAHIAEYTWALCNMKSFQFARAMLEEIQQHGGWTDGQLAAIRKCMANDLDRERKKAAVVQNAASVAGSGFDRMVAAFKSAAATGLKYPKLLVGEFTFSLAGAQSKYAGNSIFVKHEGEYRGRIDMASMKWLPVSMCPFDVQRRVLEICADPLAAAVLHGKQTGRCSCCGRELENPESVALGIGPICREKWGL